MNSAVPMTHKGKREFPSKRAGKARGLHQLTKPSNKELTTYTK